MYATNNAKNVVVQMVTRATKGARSFGPTGTFCGKKMEINKRVNEKRELEEKRGKC